MDAENRCCVARCHVVLSAVGSAFPCIKIGYGMWNIESVDTSSQILFAGMRFVLAGILAVIFGSLLEGRFIRPE